MEFEKFVWKNRRLGKPTATLFARGAIAINAATTVAYDLGKYRAVVLYYDRDTKTIGMKFKASKKSDKCALSLAKRDGGGFEISTMSFFRFFRIEPSKKKTRRHIEYNADFDMYTIAV